MNGKAAGVSGTRPKSSGDAKRADWTRADAFGSRPSRAGGQAAKRAPHGPSRAAGDAESGHYTWPRSAFSRTWRRIAVHLHRAWGAGKLRVIAREGVRKVCAGEGEVGSRRTPRRDVARRETRIRRRPEHV
ncbi:hypothetical protein C7S14_6325 [Burkholderia cepacia]|nr:hypothetical protein C7S14_6325 [Burkholderia cepacia]